MIGLTSLEVYNSSFNTTEKENKFELYADIYDYFPFMHMKHELEEIFDIEDITSKHVEDEKTGPNIKNFYEK